LQNCHLATSWLPRMEKLIEDIGVTVPAVHEDFRLWLMSMPSAAFPVATLQSSIKLTNEPPKGVRANLIGTLGVMKEEYFESCSKPGPWKKLVFSLSFFHAMIQERRKFGPLGWNVKYEFNASDLDCSKSTLKMFLDEQDEVPWESLVYVTGMINYGGRVTDDQDRRCLMTILEQYYVPSVLDATYKYSGSGHYYAPGDESITLADMMTYIRGLPMEEQPEVFGMHDNALVAYNISETDRIINTVLGIQPRVTSTDEEAATPEQLVDAMAADMEGRMPANLDMEECSPGLFDRDPETGQMDSLATVLLQEVDRFNGLLAVLRRSLGLLRKAIKGLIVMSGDLEAMFDALLSNKVPELWMTAGYPSLKPLASWYRDLEARMDFMHGWNKNGVPTSICLPFIFFTQGFLTGALQKHARKHLIPIDAIDFAFVVTKFTSDEDLVDGPPEDGCYVRGLFIEAARWSEETMTLQPSKPGIPQEALPYIHFLPAENFTPPESDYQCPLYRTNIRAGVLSTTGASTNYVLDVSFPTPEEHGPSFFVLQGTAGLTMLND